MKNVLLVRRYVQDQKYASRSQDLYDNITNHKDTGPYHWPYKKPQKHLLEEWTRAGLFSNIEQTFCACNTNKFVFELISTSLMD